MVGSAAAIRDALVPILYPGSVYVSHYGFMVMILTSTGFVVMDVVHHYRLLLSERLRADRYQSESMRDPLTGAYNRNMLDVVMEGLDGPFSVVFLDLNNFKAVNDTHGHSAGDAVLSDVVRIMGSVFRRDDAVIRTGGDEFLAVLPHCPKEKAEALTRQLEAEASASSIITESGTILKYSVSLASASYTGEGAVSPGLFSEILSAADRAMYEHKQRVKRGLR